MTDTDLVSIAEAARRLGLHRPKVSTIVTQHKIPKTKRGNESLVSLSAIQSAVQTEAAKGSVRTPTVRKEIRSEDGELKRILEEQIRELKEANRELKTENVQLRDRVEALVSVETELKLLKAGMQEPQRKGASGTKKVVREGAQKILDRFFGD